MSEFYYRATFNGQLTPDGPIERYRFPVAAENTEDALRHLLIEFSGISDLKLIPIYRATGEQYYCAEGLAGLVERRKNRIMGVRVGVYNCEQAHLDPDGGPWAVVCEDHGSILNVDTLRRAREEASGPYNWCEVCQENSISGLDKLT